MLREILGLGISRQEYSMAFLLLKLLYKRALSQSNSSEANGKNKQNSNNETTFFFYFFHVRI